MTRPLPPADPGAGFREDRQELLDAVTRVLESGSYVLGEAGRIFEEDFAAFVGAGHAVGVGNGTDALRLALEAVGVGTGQAVLTVSHTAVATVAAIVQTGATAVLADVDERTLNIDPEAVRRALETVVDPPITAIVAVHLYGRPAAIDVLAGIAERHHLALIEDCAQAHGARVGGRHAGTWGRMGCFSFYPTKNLGAFGDAGAVVTSDAVLAEKLRASREFGWDGSRCSRTTGWNSRLDEIQAAVLSVKLKRLEQANARRRAIAALYDRELAGLPGVVTPDYAEGHVYHQYVIRVPDRDRLREALRAQSIGTLVHYPLPVHLQPGYQPLVKLAAPLPVTERIAREVLSLPVYPELGDADVLRVGDAIRRVLG